VRHSLAVVREYPADHQLGELTDVQNGSKSWVGVSPFLGPGNCAWENVEKLFVPELESSFNDPLHVGPVGRAVSQANPEPGFDLVGLDAFEFTAVRHQIGGNAMAGPLFFADLDPELAAEFNFVAAGIFDRQGRLDIARTL
jgi:hypothetical protein